MLACARRSSRVRGASLIEVLVAVLILSLGLLGLAGMQMRALRGSVSSVQRTQAVILSQYLLDLMRIDRLAAMKGDYNLEGATSGSAQCTVPAATSTTSATLAKTELQAWFNAAKSQIGRAGDTTTCARVDCNLQGVCTVQLQWDDSASGGLANQSLALSTRL